MFPYKSWYSPIAAIFCYKDQSMQIMHEGEGKRDRKLGNRQATGNNCTPSLGYKYKVLADCQMPINKQV